MNNLKLEVFNLKKIIKTRENVDIDANDKTWSLHYQEFRQGPFICLFNLRHLLKTYWIKFRICIPSEETGLPPQWHDILTAR